MLVTTAEIADDMPDSRWILFDCRHDLMNPSRGREQYDAGHIPGAHFARVDQDLSGVKTGSNGRHPLPDPAVFAAFLGRKGVRPGHRIVGYDDVGGQYAARLWWMCRWIGWDNAAVLDGGLPKWLAEGRAISTAEPKVTTLGEVPLRLRHEYLITLDDLEQAMAADAVQVVDARAPERFRGEVEPLDPVAGHIPGAMNRFFKANLNADLTMKPAAELRTSWSAQLGVRAPSAVVHQCGSGITACVNLLAMEHAGLAGARLYAGSWSEWVGHADRPVATGD
jgi:thiosulfate/3-mercaptopyruvate sulfurtransferase